MVKNNIENLIAKFSDQDNLEVKKINMDKNHFYYHITSDNYSITFWDKNINGARHDLILGSVEVLNRGKGTGKYIVNLLKEYAKENGYGRIVANKAETVAFWEKQGFVPHDVDPTDYYSILK